MHLDSSFLCATRWHHLLSAKFYIVDFLIFTAYILMVFLNNVYI